MKPLFHQTVNEMEALQNLTVYELVGRIACIVVAISGVIQFTPIKLNPWSWLGRKIGKALTGDLLEAVNKLSTEMDEIKEDISKGKAANQRTKIIRFGSEIRLREKHTKDYFDEIMNDITEYERYCDAHPDFKNNITAASSEIIKETYKRCLEENSFL